jgi:hypothetical protein
MISVGVAGLLVLFIAAATLRVGLELVMSIVRTSIDARALRDKYVKP